MCRQQNMDLGHNVDHLDSSTVMGTFTSSGVLII